MNTNLFLSLTITIYIAGENVINFKLIMSFINLVTLGCLLNCPHSCKRKGHRSALPPPAPAY